MAEISLCPECVAIFVQRNTPEHYCPFCGGETVSRHAAPYGEYAGVWVRCGECENGWQDASHRLGTVLDQEDAEDA